jgi:hypothetical protein
VVSPGARMRETRGVSDANLERRVTAVEAEVAHAGREAAAARALAAGAVSDLRAHTRGLEGLRLTQIEHHAEHKADLANFRADVNAAFAAVEGRFAEVNAGLRVIAGMLERPGRPAARTVE